MGRMTYHPLAKRSKCLFHWRAADLDLEPITGQAVTFTRTGTSTVPDDNAGASYTAANYQPAWHYSTSVAEPTLRMQVAQDDRLNWAFALKPQAMTTYISFVEQGAAVSALARTFHIGHETNAATDPSLWIDSSGDYYQVTHDNNVDSAITATLAATPTAGDAVELRAVLNTDGSAIIGQSINGGSETTASTATSVTPAAAWAGQFMHINGVGGNLDNDFDFRVVKIAPGVKTMAQMRTIY